MECRQGVTVKPIRRLTMDEEQKIHHATLQILQDPGILVYHAGAAEIFSKSGAQVSEVTGEHSKGWLVKIPEALLEKALSTAPSRVILGARNPANSLILDGKVPRVYFGSGSESNFILEMSLNTFVREDDGATKTVLPQYRKKRGTVSDLCAAAHLAENLEHLDFFIRPVNIQDEEITEANKDVNKFFACLDNITKHVMAGLTDIGQIDHVLRMAEIIAGGRDALRQNPIVSFISCVSKSPLQFTQEATEKMLAVNERHMPLVISSSPQGGSTAPIDEVGIVSQINAEILGGVVLSQLHRPGCPVIYGSVPVRARMDNLHDMYGAPEFNQYNVSCVQMARFYGLPCYSTGGVADAKVPGIQATVEKMFSHLFVAQSGPHLLHYAFGLLEETNTFSFEQAVLDNAHIGIIKKVFTPPDVSEENILKNLDVIRKVMASPHRLFARYARKQLHSGSLYISYPLEGNCDHQDETMLKAGEEKARIEQVSSCTLPEAIRKRVLTDVPGILEKLH
ncbi:trimethylamine methyltransferase family protein [Dethiobacter alkaliphilus]|uniref:trimethylamine methyltransferase family protein n=1 Tax=Dethiobacter alkaliphilus TaxID=427926 RepID=UPI002227A0FB|nr:trimethylamine methyltransferase family protein [Dethiobacter alkaliphilus]MCW3490970.1 trimethylamine methyltransferase family protein [Dethiobacter alkaliphilus]